MSMKMGMKGDLGGRGKGNVSWEMSGEMIGRIEGKQG